MTRRDAFSALLLRPVVLLLFLAVAIGGCRDREPIKLGFAASMTGKMGDLGVAGRDGAQVAVDEINAAGGIGGRKLQLIARDDRSDPAVAKEVDRELIRDGVAAIIGHLTSDMSLAAVPEVDQARVLLFGPTGGTRQLTGIDDFFVRIYPDNHVAAGRLAGYLRQRLNLRTLAVAYDISNESYTGDYLSFFRREFGGSGGEFGKVMPFASKERPSYLQLAESLVKSKPNGIFILAGAVDTAMICQQVRKLDPSVPLFAAEWAGSTELLKMGGSAVEGLTLCRYFDSSDQSPSYLQFKTAYRERYKVEPTFAAAYSYEAVKIIAAALARNGGDPRRLKETLLAMGKFQGLQGEITLDRFGDAVRKVFVIRIDNGAFARVE